MNPESKPAPEEAREFTPTEERFTPLEELLDDPRLSKREREEYEFLVTVTNGRVYMREYVPSDPEDAPIREFVIGDIEE